MFCFALLPRFAAAQDQWAVPGADMRLKVQVGSDASSPDAGIILTCPNGGALPGPFPNATVVDSAGHPIHSECLWNNPDYGFAIIFTPPENTGPLWVYLQGGPSPANAWTEDSAFHPSLLLYTRVGHSTIDDARNIAGENPPSQGVRMGQVPIIADSHNRFGSSEDYASYYTGWLVAPESGAYFIGTISSDGATVVIDGKTATDWPGIHSFMDGATGNKGNVVNLAKGPHRIQYFQYFSEEGGFNPMAEVIWRTPSTGKGDLPATPRMEDYTHSGSATVTGAESRNGPPPALFDMKAVSYMGMSNNQFVDLFDLTVPMADQYKDYSLDWQFSDGSQAHGGEVLWPVIRGSQLTVTLTISSKNGSSSAHRVIYPDTLPEGASDDDAGSRRDYAQALLNKLEGAPAGASPVASWPPAFWELLPQVVQAGEAKGLLTFLYEHCSDSLGNLGGDDQKYLGDIYYDELKQDKATAPAMLNKIIGVQTDPSAQFRWELKAIDFELYEAGNIDAARQIADGLKVDPFRGARNDAEEKLIALGDVERMAGNVDAATKYYTQAQELNDKATASNNTTFAGFNDATAARVPAQSNGIVIGAANTQDADWRKRAVLQNSYYTDVKNLLDQGDLDDARDKLEQWAIAFPLAKLDGDYALAEAQYALKYENYDRAQRILKAYRHRVDLSGQLAEAMELEWSCDTELQRPDDIKELAADIKKRFPDLPLAKDADKALHGEMPHGLIGRRPADMPP